MDVPKLIFERVVEVHNAGVWRSFTAPADLKLSKWTLIYGFNGSGKTTLSRILSSIQRGAIEEKLPSKTTFSLQLSDGSKILNDPLTNPLGNRLLVFNTDFVERNFKWDTSSVTGIAYISEKNVATKTEFDGVVVSLVIAEKESSSKQSSKIKAEKALSEFKTRVAKNVREVASSNTYTQSYDARKIEAAFRGQKFGPELQLNTDELQKKQALLQQREPLPKFEILSDIAPNFLEWFRASRKIIETALSSRVIEQLETHTAALKWVHDGLTYHQEHELETCIFCGNEFTFERRKSLEAMFEGSWTKALEEINRANQEGIELVQGFRDLYSRIPKSQDIQAVEQVTYAAIQQKLQESIVLIGKQCKEMNEALAIKLGNPIQNVVLSESFSNFDFEGWHSDYLETQENLNNVIKKHNAAFDQFKTLQTEAFRAIEKHIFSSEQSTWNRFNRELQEAAASSDAAITALRTLKERHQTLRNSLEDHGVAAGKLNEMLLIYLGHKEIQLVPEQVGYRIVRAGGEAATELSEGERTAVSFCFFLTQLGAEGRNIKEIVLVIDDPISSLDTSARTYAYSLMMRMTKNCAQLIVLTHNAGFMNMVKRQFQNLQKRNTSVISSFLVLDCKSSAIGPGERRTSLVPMSDLLTKYDTEYQYLFKIVRSAAKDGSTEYHYLLPNATRKLLEMFGAFCSPGKTDFAEALMDHQAAIKDTDVRALERLIQIESHGTMDGLAGLPELTIEEAIKAAVAAMAFIKALAKGHHDQMCRVCA